MASLPTLRASDADREHIATLLHQATVEGRLSGDELEERLGALYGARTYGELDALVADLPVSEPPGRAPAVRWVLAGSVLVGLLALLGAVAVAAREHVSAAAGGPGLRLPGPVAEPRLGFLLAASAAVVLVFLVGCVAAAWVLMRSRSTSRA